MSAMLSKILTAFLNSRGGQRATAGLAVLAAQPLIWGAATTYYSSEITALESELTTLSASTKSTSQLRQDLEELGGRSIRLRHDLEVIDAHYDSMKRLRELASILDPPAGSSTPPLPTSQSPQDLPRVGTLQDLVERSRRNTSPPSTTTVRLGSGESWTSTNESLRIGISRIRDYESHRFVFTEFTIAGVRDRTFSTLIRDSAAFDIRTWKEVYSVLVSRTEDPPDRATISISSPRPLVPGVANSPLVVQIPFGRMP